MATGREEHAREHEFVEIIDSETITAFEQSPHGIITLQLHQRGFSLDLSYQGAFALGVMMEKEVKHVNAKRQQ